MVLQLAIWLLFRVRPRRRPARSPYPPRLGTKLPSMMKARSSTSADGSPDEAAVRPAAIVDGAVGLVGRDGSVGGDWELPLFGLPRQRAGGEPRHPGRSGAGNPYVTYSQTATGYLAGDTTDWSCFPLLAAIDGSASCPLAGEPVAFHRIGGRFTARATASSCRPLWCLLELRFISSSPTA